MALRTANQLGSAIMTENILVSKSLYYSVVAIPYRLISTTLEPLYFIKSWLRISICLMRHMPQFPVCSYAPGKLV